MAISQWYARTVLTHPTMPCSPAPFAFTVGLSGHAVLVLARSDLPSQQPHPRASFFSHGLSFMSPRNSNVLVHHLALSMT